MPSDPGIPETRRHQDAAQRSAVAAELANLANGQKASSANLQSTAVTQTEAATLLNVSPRAVTTATKVKDESPPMPGRPLGAEHAPFWAAVTAAFPGTTWTPRNGARWLRSWRICRMEVFVKGKILLPLRLQICNLR